MRVRKLPVVVDAVLWTGENPGEVERTLGLEPFCFDGVFTIHTLEGDMTAQPGDWIIKGIEGEFYPCKPEIYAKTYEAV